MLCNVNTPPLAVKTSTVGGNVPETISALYVPSGNDKFGGVFSTAPVIATLALNAFDIERSRIGPVDGFAASLVRRFAAICAAGAFAALPVETVSVTSQLGAAAVDAATLSVPEKPAVAGNAIDCAEVPGVKQAVDVAAAGVSLMAMAVVVGAGAGAGIEPVPPQAASAQLSVTAAVMRKRAKRLSMPRPYQGRRMENHG